MPASMEQSELRVEGPDDQNSLIHLLIRHGIDYDRKPWLTEFPKIVDSKGVDKLLAGMERAIRDSTGRVLGFVLDADSPVFDRWQAVRDRLRRVAVADVPENPPATGFIGEAAISQVRLGIWLMPDNQHDGKLEDFLKTLIEQDDPLIGHAESATDSAKQLGASFTDPDRIKAVLHAWLAWQENPGLPFGTAIRATYFRHDSEIALKFIAWFRQLYNIPPASA